MQTTEKIVLGPTVDVGPVAAMQSGAEFNSRANLVDPDNRTDIAGQKGVCIVATDVLDGLLLMIEYLSRIIMRRIRFLVLFLGGRVLRIADTDEGHPSVPSRIAGVKVDAITMGKAL
ncbi:late embryogenesis abundant protein D-34-like [Aristolochia californica]|uniref:late embryogenesis abundant protein D-34-like n=1 Tax=Aristolochia californica TaxID=171875 RepID=UPI0035E1BAEC